MQPTDVKVEVADGVRLRVRYRPGPNGPPFLLVHGLSSNALVWDEVARRLNSAGYSTYSVDLRSHGESDAPPDGYDTATAAADLAVVSAHLGLGAAVVAGQSWGGNVVVRFAAKRPAMVSALALVDGGWVDLTEQFATWEECAAALRPPDVDGRHADDIRAMLRGEHPDWSPAAVEATLASLRVGSDGYVTRRLPIAQHMRIVHSMWADPPWSDHANIVAPVLLVPAIPAEPVAAQRRRAAVDRAAWAAAANARIKEYVGADHDLHAQHPAELAEDILTLARES